MRWLENHLNLINTYSVALENLDNYRGDNDEIYEEIRIFYLLPSWWVPPSNHLSVLTFSFYCLMPASPICQQSRFPSKGCTLIDLEAWGRVDQDSSHAGLEIVRKYLANDISPCFQGEMVITINGKVSLVKL